MEAQGAGHGGQGCRQWWPRVQAMVAGVVLMHEVFGAPMNLP